MPARVIHFGPDDCHRLMVLRSAGYAVDDCHSLVELRTTLANDAAPDALVTSDAEGFEPKEAIALVKTRASIPVVLFRSTNLACEDSGVDLVVHCLTPPEVWLSEVDALIEKCRGARPRSERPVNPSAQLRRESSAARNRPRVERQRAKFECARNAGPFADELFLRQRGPGQTRP
jgi:hypothetical protein